jgi:hypothetical protein
MQIIMQPTSCAPLIESKALSAFWLRGKAAFESARSPCSVRQKKLNMILRPKPVAFRAADAALGRTRVAVEASRRMAQDTAKAGRTVVARATNNTNFVLQALHASSREQL